MLRRRWALFGLSLALGCTGPTSTAMIVELETDFVPEIEFRHIETELVAVVDGEASGATLLVRREPAFDPASASTLLQVATFEGIEHGSYLLTTRLRAVDGLLVGDATRLVSFSGAASVVRLLISRECSGVFCPGPGDPAANTRCRAGICVPERCAADDPDCRPECTEDRSCAPSSECAEPHCVEGECLQTPVHSLCGANEWCAPDSGCRPLDAPCSEESCTADPCQDAQCVDGRCVVRERCRADEICCADTCAAPGCSDGDPCTADACGALGCEHEPVDAGPCDDEVFCNGSDTCVAGACTGHTGDPCTGTAVCDEEGGVCVGCSVAADCGPPVRGPPTACDYADVCDTSARSERAVTSFECVSRVCTPTVSNETVPCSRSTTGTSCGSGGRVCRSGSCTCPGGTSETSCTDGRDNDCDDLVDCADSDCAGQACDDGQVCTGGEVCSAGSCGGGAPGRAVRRCADPAIGMYLHVTDGPCPGTCGLTDQGVVWREVPGQTASAYQVAHGVACGGTECNGGYFVSPNPTAGGGFYCDVGGISSRYAATALPGTLPLYRYYDPSVGQYSGLDGTAPGPGYVRQEVSRYVCPP